MNRFLAYLFVLIVAFLGTQSAWAINSPEPQSGGRFFPGKGTRAASADYSVYPYEQRSESGSFEQHHYAKGVKLGIVRIEPTLGYTGEWDTNIFLRESKRDADYINRLVGGLDAYVPIQDGKYLLMGGVKSKSEWFTNHSEENHTDWSYQLGAEANLEAVQLAVHDEFRDTTDRSDSELTERIQRYENRLRGLVTVPFGKFFSETEVSDFILDFHDNANFEQFDRHEFSVFPRFGLDIGTRTQALVEYGFTNLSYDEQDDRDGTAHQGQLGVRGFLGNADLISYQLWGGWQFRHYDSSNLDSFNGFIGHGELTYKVSEVSQFILKVVRRPEESVSSDQTFYVRNEASLRYRRQIAEKWYVNAQIAAGLNHYSNDRLDFLWEPGAGIEYLLPGKILAVFSEYKYSGRNSDVEGRDYGRHIVDIGIKAEV